MKIYVKSPFYKNSDFMAHLVEHCALHPNKDDIEQCVLKSRASWWLSGEHTHFDFDDFIDYKKILALIHKPITQDMIDYEMNIFQEEFGSVGYIIRLYEKLMQSYFGTDRSWRQQKYSLEEVQQYRDEHYKHYIIIDDTKDVIVEHNITNLQTLNTIVLPDLTVSLVYLEGEKNNILSSPLHNFTDLIIFYFIYDVIKSRDRHKKRYILESYYSHRPSDMYTSTHCIIRISPHTALDISPERFELQKDYFLKELEHNQYMTLEALSILYCRQEYNKELAKKIIDWIWYEYLINIIEQIKNLE